MIDIDIRKPLLSAVGTIELHIKLRIEERSFVAVMGESGSGKTTFLRILAGLEEATGTIRVEDEIWLSPRITLPPQKRRIGFVFQDYALFENMTVKENLLFVRRDETLARHLLEMTDLLQLADRYPAGLSGGQKQRVALCRAMMNRPRLLLMDEPLSALDPQMREKLQNDILRLHREFGTTTVMVSHDPAEIYRLADRVVQISRGRIIADGTPPELFLNRSDDALSFHGRLLETVEESGRHYAVIAIGSRIAKIPISVDRLASLEGVQEIRVAFLPEAATIEAI